jgi:sugar lactone lactonase YvrE
LPAAGGGFIAGMKTGLHYFNERTGEFRLIAQVEQDLPANRINDGTVDSLGRLWFGTMDNLEREETGAIYRLGDKGEIIPSGGECCITNGPAVSRMHTRSTMSIRRTRRVFSLLFLPFSTTVRSSRFIDRRTGMTIRPPGFS